MSLQSQDMDDSIEDKENNENKEFIQEDETLPFDISEVSLLQDKDDQVFVKYDGMFYSIDFDKCSNIDLAIVDESELEGLESVDPSVIQNPSNEGGQSQNTSSLLSRRRD
jgi:hypothetical protein